MAHFPQLIHRLKTHKSGSTVSLHKPLLLLLAISEIHNGHTNSFVYDDIESKLTELLVRYGLKNTTNYKPYYPFIYLSSQPDLWRCSVKKEDLRHRDSASRRELLGATGAFPLEFYTYLTSENNALHFISLLLNEYWPEAYHDDLLNDLGINDLELVPRVEKANRRKEFVEEVLDAYECRCAVCRQSIRLGDKLLGIDACHVRPLEHNGADQLTNGIALCKTHHWALDRGAISISSNMHLLISPSLYGSKISDFFTTYASSEIFTPHNTSSELDPTNIKYHQDFIFVK